MYMKGLTAIFTVALSSTLIGCQTTKTENTEPYPNHGQSPADRSAD